MVRGLVNESTFIKYFLMLFWLFFLNHHYFQGIYKQLINEMEHQLQPLLLHDQQSVLQFDPNSKLKKKVIKLNKKILKIYQQQL